MTQAHKPRPKPAARTPLRGAPSELCTVAEAADLLGVSVSTVWRWVDSGKLAGFRVGPKAIRIRRQDVHAAVQPLRPPDAVKMGSVFVDADTAGQPLTQEERERGLAALATADEFRAQVLRRRKGRPLSDSAAIIREAREERSRRL